MQNYTQNLKISQKLKGEEFFFVGLSDADEAEGFAYLTKTNKSTSTPVSFSAFFGDISATLGVF